MTLQWHKVGLNTTPCIYNYSVQKAKSLRISGVSKNEVLNSVEEFVKTFVFLLTFSWGSQCNFCTRSVPYRPLYKTTEETNTVEIR